MADSSVTLRNYLLSVSALAALGGRIYAERDVPPPGYALADGPCIAFGRRGGVPEYVGKLVRNSYQVKVYAASEAEAGQLDDALYAALQDHKGDGILQAECEVLAQHLREPDTGWPYALSFWLIITRR